MNDTQEIFYTNKYNEYTFYMINHREKRYCIIPNKYNGFCMHLYCLGIYEDINYKIAGLELVEFEKVNG